MLGEHDFFKLNYIGILANMPEFVKDQLVWIKANLNTLLLIAMVALFVLLSFASGYIIATYQDRPPITVNQPA